MSLLRKQTAKAMKNKQIILYVSKGQTKESQAIIIKNNLTQSYGRIEISRNEQETDEKIIKDFRIALIAHFQGLSESIYKNNLVNDLKIIFNKEYTISGEALYFNTPEKGEYFHQVRSLKLHLPLTENEIALFFRALSEVPFY